MQRRSYALLCTLAHDAKKQRTIKIILVIELHEKMQYGAINSDEG